MKLLVFCVLWLFFVGVGVAQPTIQWQKSLGGSGSEETKSVVQTNDGGFIVAGYCSSNNNGDVMGAHGGGDAWVVKLNQSGELQWQNSLGGSSSERADAILQTSDGGYILAGSTGSNDGDVSGNHGDWDYWVVKLNSSGQIEWQKTLGGSNTDQAYSIQQTSDGGYIVVGGSASIDGDVTGNHGYLDFWIVKLGSQGGIQWEKSLGGGTGAETAYCIRQTNDGGYILTGQAQSDDGDVTGNHGDSDFWVVKLDSTGIIEWQKSLGGGGIEAAYSIQQTAEGGYIVAGLTGSYNTGQVTGSYGAFDFWVVKLNDTGNIQWQKVLGGSDEDWGRTICQTMDGGYVVTGATTSTDGDVIDNDGGADYWLVKLDPGGKIQWQKTLGGTQADLGWSTTQTSDGGYIISGFSWSNDGDVSGNHGKTDIWVVKLSPESSPTSEVQTQTLQIYPNPAQNTIAISIPTSFEADDNHTLAIQITDLLGRTLHHQTISTNQPINISTLPNGFYLLSATTPTGTVFSGKFTKQD